MGLVDYSDSDSDSESPQAVPRPPTPEKKPPGSGLSALLPKPKDKNKAAGPSDGPKKIIVNIPKFTDEGAADGPPAKKPRIGGGGGGLSALLPAPKRRKVDNAEGAPSSAPPLAGKNEEEKNGNGEEGGGEKEKAEEEKKAKPSTVFMPQSVARKSIQPMSAFKKGKSAGGVATAAVKKQPDKPKVSLFGSAATVSTSAPPKPKFTAPTGEYKPIMLEAAKPMQRPAEEEEEEDAAPVEASIEYGETSVQLPYAHDLHSVANGLGLSESEMRKLYGRQGMKGDQQPIQMASFSVDEEYNQNELARQLGLVEDAQPVRSIQPGKHQLRTLLTSAQSQKTALEDSFAAGKKNRKEAGQRYGW